MKKKIYAIALLSFVVTQLNAQCGQRYKDLIFPTVSKTTVVYNVHPFPRNEMDIYQPVGDTETERPLIILAHGGSFTSGSKTDDIVIPELCTSFAKRGYVAAAINYRLAQFFWDMLDSTKAIEVVLKAISDGKAAVRYFRQDAYTTNTYRIDTNHIFVGGNSAGAVLFMHYIYLDSLGEAPANLRNIINNNGGFEGNSGNPGYSSEVHALVNLAGGLNVPEFVGPNSKPSVNFHGDQDNVVPYGCAYAQGGATPVRLCGLGAVEPLYQQHSVNHVSVVFPGDGHTPWLGNAAKMTRVDTVTANFLYSLLCTSTAVTDVSANAGVNVFPNPSNDKINVSFTDAGKFTHLTLSDYTGRVVFHSPVSGNNVTIAKGDLAEGIYLLEIQTSDNEIISRKVIFE